MKKPLIPFLLICQALVFSPIVMGESAPETISLTLLNAQQAAEKNSDSLESAMLLLEAAKAQATSVSSSLYPRLDLNGNYFYQTHVPTQASAGSSIRMGDNDNYSVGPVLSYTLFDGNKIRNNNKSARLRADAKEQDLLAQKRELKHFVNLTYARVQLYATNLALTMDALKLSQGQSIDIDLRFNVGTASKLDQISAHKEMLNYKLLFYQAQNDLASALRDLLALTGEKKTYRTERPLPSKLASELPKEIDAPTLLISIDPLASTLTAFSSTLEQIAPPGELTPHIKSLSLSARSLHMSFRSQRGANWPKINLSAESRTAYPDSSKEEQYNNNIFAVRVSLPLWDAKQNRGLAEKYLNESKAEEHKRAQVLSDMTRDHIKALDAISNLRSQQAISQETCHEAEEISRLTYHAYTAGRSTFLEVQSSNLKLMQARVTTAKIEYDLINKIATMEYLSRTNPL